MDTIIRGGTLHSSVASFDGDIAIEGDKVAAIGERGAFDRLAAGRVIDATGMDVIPGCIDVHVHLALPFCGTVSCDDFEHGSYAALNGCVTAVIDFAIPGKNQTLADAHRVWTEKAAGKSLIDFSWHMAITSDAHVQEVPSMVKSGLPTFKEFMIYESEGWNSDDARMFATLEKMRDHDGMLLVHAESSKVLDELIRRHHIPDQMRAKGARLHRETRPNFIEAEAIERAIRWSEVTGGRLYVVHMSTGEGADLIRAAQSRGVPVIAETCAQYLVLEDSVFDRPDGHLYACCPQVKKVEDIDRLWAGLGDEVSVVSTDTCSFTREQKQMWWNPAGYGDWTKIPMGLPGLDTLVPIVYTHGVRAGRITMNDLVALCATNPAKIMGIRNKGELVPGFDADIAIIDPNETREAIPGKTLRSRCDWSPFEGMRLGGFAKHVLLRGEPMVLDGKIVGKPGHGKFMSRSLAEE